MVYNTILIRGFTDRSKTKGHTSAWHLMWPQPCCGLWAVRQHRNTRASFTYVGMHSGGTLNSTEFDIIAKHIQLQAQLLLFMFHFRNSPCVISHIHDKFQDQILDIMGNISGFISGHPWVLLAPVRHLNVRVSWDKYRKIRHGCMRD